MEREVEVGRVDLLGFISHFAPDRPHVPRELEDPVAVRGQSVHEAGEEVRKGYAATWASWCEEVGIRGADDGWRSGWKGVEDVGIFYGAGHYQHGGNPGAMSDYSVSPFFVYAESPQVLNHPQQTIDHLKIWSPRS